MPLVLALQLELLFLTEIPGHGNAVHGRAVVERGQIIEVDAVNLVDHLADEVTRLHVIVGVFEDIANN